MSMSTKRRAALAGAAASLAIIALSVLPSQAVVCPPGEPDFAYRDVGNDGCFNMGTDTEIPEATLVAGAYDANPDGIVVPATVKLAPTVNISWSGGSQWIRGEIDSTANVSISSPGNIEIESGAEISAVEISISNGSAIVIGDGVKLTGNSTVYVSGFTGVSVGSAARLTGGSLTFSSNAPINIGEGTDLESTSTGVSLSSGGTIELQAGVAVVATTTISISNGGPRNIGDGVSLTAVNNISVGGSASTTFGNNVKISGGLVAFGAGGAVQAGEKLSVESSEFEISVSAGAGVTFGTKAKLASATYLSMSGGGGGISLGAGSKLVTDLQVTMSCAGAITMLEKCSIKAGGYIDTFNGGDMDIGAKSKLSAGLDIELTPNNTGSSLVVGESVKITSGTQKAPMQMSTILLDSGAIQLGAKASIKGSDKLNTITILPVDSFTAAEKTKLAGQTITIGDAFDAPFAPFTMSTNVKGSADGATFTINAPMTTCDLTGSKFSKVVVNHASCAAVVGP
jgi:hypothetical protein